MATGQTFNFDLKLPQSPPTENKELYEQLEYLYKAVRTLAETFQIASAEFVDSLLAAGANVSLTSDLTVPSITIAVPTEGIQDLVAALAVAGTGVTITYDDTLGTLTFAALPPVLTEATPASASATGTKGSIVYDTSYLYVCVATDTWRRIPHATW